MARQIFTVATIEASLANLPTETLAKIVAKLQENGLTINDLLEQANKAEVIVIEALPPIPEGALQRPDLRSYILEPRPALQQRREFNPALSPLANCKGHRGITGKKGKNGRP